MSMCLVHVPFFGIEHIFSTAERTLTSYMLVHMEAKIPLVMLLGLE